MLEVERPGEPLEQPLAAAEDDRGDDDRELVDETCLERLPDDVRAAHDVDVLATGGFPGALDRLLDAGDEREPAALGLLLGPVRHDEERHGPRVLAAPGICRVVGPAAGDDRAEPRHRLVQPDGVLARRLAQVFLVVRPRAAEHPVVETLAALAEPLPGAVVPAGDVAVYRRRDPSENLG